MQTPLCAAAPRAPFRAAPGVNHRIALISLRVEYTTGIPPCALQWMAPHHWALLAAAIENLPEHKNGIQSDRALEVPGLTRFQSHRMIYPVRNCSRRDF